MNRVHATNSDFQITVSLQPNVKDTRYFKLWIQLDQIIYVWNMNGLRHQVAKTKVLENLNLWQWFNFFVSSLRPVWSRFWINLHVFIKSISGGIRDYILGLIWSAHQILNIYSDLEYLTTGWYIDNIRYILIDR